MLEFPVFIVSKGRALNGSTARYLLKMGIEFRLIVEEQEREEYAKHFGEERLLILPPSYKAEYQTLDDRDDERVGPGAARNFALDTARAEGTGFHWVMDDNIEGWGTYDGAIACRDVDGVGLRSLELWAKSCTNLGGITPSYNFDVVFGHSRANRVASPTRLYSCQLLNNEIPVRWRGRYNEDTILSLDLLSAGFACVQSRAVLQYKAATQKYVGGNTAEFYEDEGTLRKSQMIADVYPRVARVVHRFGRVHHHVNYGAFSHVQPIRVPVEERESIGFVVRDDFDPRAWAAKHVIAEFGGQRVEYKKALYKSG